jgi:type IX secretion system PorP/SprF family membrane protein
MVLKVISVNFFCIFFVLFLATLSSSGQDPLFNNAQQSLIYLNPSFAGSNGFVRHQAIYRNQSIGSGFPYITLFNGFDAYITSNKGGIALTHVYDDCGNGYLKSNTVTFSYAQYFSLLENKLRIIPSIQFAGIHRKFDFSTLRFGEVIDARYQYVWKSVKTLPSEEKINFDISSGLLINYKHFYFGTSVFHINQPNIGSLGYDKLPYRFSCHSSVKLVETNWFQTSVFIRYERQKKFNYGQIRVNSIARHALVGLSYGYATNISELYSYYQTVYAKSKNHTFGFNLGYRNNFFTLGVGYDRLFFSGNSKLFQDSWEAQLSINIRDKEHRKSLTDFEKW